MLYVFLFTFFFVATHFHALVAASISHLLAAAIKLSSYSSNEIGLLPLFVCLFVFFFISRSSSFSVIHGNVDIEIKSKERIAFVVVVVVFLSLKSGWLCDLPPKRALLEMKNFTPGYIKVWTNVRTIFSESKFSGCIDNQIFLNGLFEHLR